MLQWILTFILALSNLISQPQEVPWVSGEASSYGYGEPLSLRTACGNIFDPDLIAVALPEVIDDKSFCGKTVEIRWKDQVIKAIVNDTGPKKSLNRVADLTKGATQALGIEHPTVIQIEMRFLEGK